MSASHAATPARLDPTPTVHDLVIVANRLPVDRLAEPGPRGELWQPSPGGLVTALEPVLRRSEGVWIGWTGGVDDPAEDLDVEGMHLRAVPLSVREVTDYYEGMSNGTLWPLYHDVISPPQFRRGWWEAYCAVNRRFAQAAAERAAPGATVWVQDYQLQLVPAMLRELRGDVRIGFFNHIPFPPYEIYAQLPWRKQVLEGLLGADLIGFQRAADANNMLRACRRLRIATRRGHALVPGPDGIRSVTCTAFPISVDAAALDELARRPGVRARAQEIRAELGDPKVVMLGVDRLDYTKGIRHRIKAVSELFDEGRIATPEVTFVQVATPSRERVGSYRALREEVEVDVGRINGLHGRLGHPAVHYLHQSFPREELAALYLAADVMLVTALRDGMNLVAKEYVASRFDERGALVLSEFTGAANELQQAQLVNPHDIDGLKEAVMTAIHLPERDMARRMRAMRRTVFRHDIARWADNFLETLGAQGNSTSSDVDVHGAAGMVEPTVPDRLHQALVDFSARRRILVATDFDGVLAPIVDRPEDARPLPAARLALGRLAELPDTHVVMVSGRSLDSLRSVAEPPAGIGLIGSHGAEVSLADGRRTHGGTGLSEDQQRLLARLLVAADTLAARFPGVMVENKSTSVAVHTRALDRAHLEALRSAIVEGPASWPQVRLVAGKEVFELLVSSQTKGSALADLRRRLDVKPGAVLYLGDDVTDEHAFAVLDPEVGDIGIKVGEGATLATHRLSGPEAVADVLQWLVGLRMGAQAPSADAS